MDDAYLGEPPAHEPVPRQMCVREAILDSLCSQTFDLNSIMGARVDVVPSCRGVPAVMCDGVCTMYIVHLYSGRRRPHDCHWWMERLAAQFLPSCQVKMLSVDSAVHPSLGDLGAGANYQTIVSLARTGFFSASMTGPPCETYSAARHVQPDQCKDHGASLIRWPRPLRSPSRPWGLQCLSMKELHQLSIGSTLMLHNWHIEVPIILHGGAALKEHPAPAKEEHKASIWRTESHQKLLMCLPRASEHRVDQWRYGSVGCKPTILRAANMGDASRTQHLLRTVELPMPTKPHSSLSGKDTGLFKTAAAKEYPSRLPFAMSACMLISLQRRVEKEGLRMCTENLSAGEADWVAFVEKESQHYRSSCFLPDFQS